MSRGGAACAAPKVVFFALRKTRRRAQRQATESFARLKIFKPQSDRCAVNVRSQRDQTHHPIPLGKWSKIISGGERRLAVKNLLLVMRRLGVVGLDVIHFNRLHRSRLAQDFFFHALQKFPLRDDHAVQLLDLMFQVREVGFDFGEPGGGVFVHANGVQDFFQT
jgi:hypothetical protein